MAFTDHLEYSGHPGYFNGLPPKGKSNATAPAVRSDALPPVVRPRGGLWSWTKNAIPPTANPGWNVRGQTAGTLGR